MFTNFAVQTSARLLFYSGILLLVCGSAAGAIPPPDDVKDRIVQHISAGEFSVALEMARQQPAAARDESMALIARAQRLGGAGYGAYNTAASIGDDDYRSATFSMLQNAPSDHGAAGGVTAADFTELMQLIQNVVQPDTWEQDGPAMRPYPAGVYVDANGALKRVARGTLRNAAEFEATLLRDSGNRDLEKASTLRKVSLTRLERTLQKLAAQGCRPSDAMRHLAGLYRVEYVWFDPITHDVIIAGPAGPMDFGADGQRVNRDTKQPVLLLDDFVQCLRNAWTQHGQLGCSIDPREENLARTQEFLNTTKLTGEKFRSGLQSALGLQDITIHGLAPNSHAGQVIVEADYLMKCIGLGIEPSIPEVPSYWDRIDLQNGPPPALQISRWWFTMNYDAILANPAETIFKVEGQGVQVLSENEFLALTGQRIHTGQSQGPTKSYAQDFTKHFNALCQKYPALGQLRNVFDLALISTLIYQQTQTGIARWSPNYFCGESHSASSLRYSIESVPTPQNVMSVVNHRYFDTHQGGRHFRHMVVGVGGGVEFDAPRLIKSSLNKTTPSDQLENVAAQSAAPKNDPSQWWWD